MKKMQDYIVKGKRVFIGLEDSKRNWKISVRCDNMIVHETSMPTDFGNLREYLRRAYPGCEIRLIYEAGFGGFWLHDLLEEVGIRCIVTPPSKVTQEKVNRVKTDKIDARRLAQNLEKGDYVSCRVPDKERRGDRQISRTLDQIQRDIIATKNRIRRFLDFHGLNTGLPAGAWKISSYRMLGKLPVSEPLRISLEAYLSLLEHLESLRLSLTAELKALSQKECYRESVEIKASFPGVGWLSAIRFTLEWGELSRFKTGKHIASFTGLTSREYSTGETVRRGRITGQGSRQVRAWLIQCAWRAIHYDPVLLSKFRSICSRSGSKKKAIVGVARKMAVRMRALELLRQPYCVGVIE